jgi:hypothetical protein
VPFESTIRYTEIATVYEENIFQGNNITLKKGERKREREKNDNSYFMIAKCSTCAMLKRAFTMQAESSFTPSCVYLSE